MFFELHDPHRTLGLHARQEDQVIRFWQPDIASAAVEIEGKLIAAAKIAEEGLFEAVVSKNVMPQHYKLNIAGKESVHDPYAFWPTWGEVDSFLFNQGVHYELYHRMGGRLVEHQGVKGAKFAVWAPSATAVAVVGDFNHWDDRRHPMRSMGASGVWELFIPGLREGDLYKFALRTRAGAIRLKADPYALYSEQRPCTASRLFDIGRYRWQDAEWMQRRGRIDRPIAIYEVHLGSWKKGLGYRELAFELARYCKELAFTHVELLPIAEHPLDESWGYQVTGFFAVTSRFGTPEDFQFFVDYLHGEGIGVILDWVPGHFPMDDFALAQFDGSYLYEHADPRQGFHPHWNTNIFNYGRKEVANFLIASALFWLEQMHVDGLRVDAVASMLYLDYGRQEEEWIPNQYGGNLNLEAKEFLKHFNSIVHQRIPQALIFAEESTAFPAVTTPVVWDGLGFDMKWNMGWMNDTLRYFHKDPIYRCFHQGDLTFGLIYAFSERFILTLSHDEMVHGKKSLIGKMPGDHWQKFANVRLLYSYMICQPGKKLLFMGAEIGQWEEWRSWDEIAWGLLQYDFHRQLQHCIRCLNQLYQERAALWERDFSADGFTWVDFQDAANSVISYLRKSAQGSLLCIHHFTPSYLENYFIRLPGLHKVREIFSSDATEFGGSGKINAHVQISENGITIQLPPLATAIFEVS